MHIPFEELVLTKVIVNAREGKIHFLLDKLTVLPKRLQFKIILDSLQIFFIVFNYFTYFQFVTEFEPSWSEIF